MNVNNTLRNFIFVSDQFFISRQLNIKFLDVSDCSEYFGNNFSSFLGEDIASLVRKRNSQKSTHFHPPEDCFPRKTCINDF